MDRLYLRFPSGGIGFGLLLLRLIVATWFFGTGVAMIGASTAGSIVALLLMSIASNYETLPFTAGVIRLSALLSKPRRPIPQSLRLAAA